MGERILERRVWLLVGLAIVLVGSYPVQAQIPKYEVDPTWPKPLPGLMVTGRAGGICVDAQDHVFEIKQKVEFAFDAGRPRGSAAELTFAESFRECHGP